MDLSVYNELLQQAKNDSNKSQDVQRKCMIQMLSASKEPLDNLSLCNLLETKFNNYLDKSQNSYKNSLQQILCKSGQTANVQLQSNLTNIDCSSLLKSLDCSHQNNCTTTEKVNEDEFHELFDVFKNQSNAVQNESNFSKSKSVEFERRYPLTENNKLRSNTSNFQFKTALDELQIQNAKKFGNGSMQQNTTISSGSNTSGQKRTLGLGRRTVNSKFVSPALKSSEEIKSEEWPTTETDDKYKNIDAKMVELIKSEIMDCGPNIHWNDIAGLSFAKTTIQEAVVWPMLRPDIFTGLRRPPKGILLFGPPGTGKTLIGKCVASQSKSTFFSISASSLTSKWVGEGEKMVRALFTVARVHQPAVIFIDEIDSLLSQRSDTEHESSRRIKTEFLVQLDGATTDSEERLLVIGATNRPQELDEAARRRFVKRLYIPLPEYEARLQLVQKLIAQERHEITGETFQEIAKLSEGYSGADIKNLCSEAALGPIRSIDMSLIEHISACDVRPLQRQDFINAVNRVRSSVAQKDLEQYIQWDTTYGSGTG